MRWLYQAVLQDLSPESALATVARHPGSNLEETDRRQLLADWRVARQWGVFTEDNLARLRAGLSPVATGGRFAGATITVVAIRGSSPPRRFDNLAFCPATVSVPPPEALADQPNFVSQFNPLSPNSVSQRISPPPPARPAPGVVASADPLSLRAETVEVHDVRVGDALSIGNGRKLTVASVNNNVLSVSVLGDGPKVRRKNLVFDNYGGTRTYYTEHEQVNNSKVPKANPVHLPGLSGDAYLIYSQGANRYYYVDLAVNNGGAFRIVKVLP